MFVTRMAVFIGIWCSMLMASPLAANASEFSEYIGLSDRGSTTVRDCGNGKRGRERFANNTALNVELNMNLHDGDGLDADDTFDAVFVYDNVPITPLFSGFWSKIDERNGRESYKLVPNGELTELTELPIDSSDPIYHPLVGLSGDLGWADLLGFVNAEAGDACKKAPPENIYPVLSVLVKGTLVVNTSEKGEIEDCPTPEVSCSKADLRLDVKVFMDDGDDGWGSAKVDRVRFRYRGKGYVVLSNP
jgi:hypothetical protein